MSIDASQPPPLGLLPSNFRDPDAKIEDLGGGAWRVTVDTITDGIPTVQSLVIKPHMGSWKMDIDAPRLAVPFGDLTPELQSKLKAMFDKNSVTYNKLVDLSELMTLIRKLTSDINKAASDMKGELMLINAQLAKEEKNLKIDAAKEDVKAAKMQLAGAMAALGTAVAGAVVSFGMTAGAARSAHKKSEGLNAQKTELDTAEGASVDKFNAGPPKPAVPMDRGPLSSADKTRMKQLGNANDRWGNQDLGPPEPPPAGNPDTGRVVVNGEEYRPGNSLGREHQDLKQTVPQQERDVANAKAQQADLTAKNPEPGTPEAVALERLNGGPEVEGSVLNKEQKLMNDSGRLLDLNEAEVTYARRAAPVPMHDADGAVIPGETFQPGKPGEPGGSQTAELNALKARKAHASFNKDYNSKISQIENQRTQTVQLGNTISQTLQTVGGAIQGMMNANATILTAEEKATLEAQAMMAATQRQNNNELMSSLAGEEGKFDAVMSKMFELAERAWSVSANIGKA